MKNFCTIYLVRHGETDWNIASLIQGHSDISLNKNGKRQAQELAKTLSHIRFDAIFSSDLIRAKNTAEVFAAKDKVKVQTSRALRERYFGIYEGKSFKKFDKEIFSLIKQKKTVIETDEQILKRVLPFIKSIIKKYLNKKILVVTHGGTMRCFLIRLGFGTNETLPPGSIKNLAYAKIKADGENFIIEETSGITKKL